MKRFSVLFILTILCFSQVGCSLDYIKKMKDKANKNKTQAKAGNSVREVIIPVQVEVPVRGDISDYFETFTRVIAENRVDIVAQVVAKCIELRVEEGDVVKKGDILAKLDNQEAMASLKQSQAVVDQRTSDHARISEGFRMKVNSQAELDAAKFGKEQAEASLELQKIQVAKHTIVAPINGTITSRGIQPGAYTSGGSAVFSIVDYTSFMLTINPPEKELPRLKIGQEAKVTIDSLGGEIITAKVRRINPSVDAMSGTVKVKLDFDEGTQSKLMESAFTRVDLIMDTHKNVLLVAKDSIVEDNARKYLFVVKEAEGEGEGEEEDAKASEKEDIKPKSPAKEKSLTEGKGEGEGEGEPGPRLIADRIEVETGLEDSNYTEVLSGIDDSSLIVTLGQHSLKPNTRIRISSFDEELAKNVNMTAEEALVAAKAAREKNKGTEGGDKLEMFEE